MMPPPEADCAAAAAPARAVAPAALSSASAPRVRPPSCLSKSVDVSFAAAANPLSFAPMRAKVSPV